MLRSVDGDVFGAVTRLGRNAVDAVARALDGADWDPFCAERCIDVLIVKAKGIRSLPAVLAEVDALRRAPLLAGVLIEETLQRITDLTRDARGSVLELMLRSVAHRCILARQYEARVVVERLCTEMLDRAILRGRGGFLEQHGSERIGDARSVLASVAVDAASALLARPDAKRLGLARRHANVEADSDLLGGA